MEGALASAGCVPLALAGSVLSETLKRLTRLLERHWIIIAASDARRRRIFAPRSRVRRPASSRWRQYGLSERAAAVRVGISLALRGLFAGAALLVTGITAAALFAISGGGSLALHGAAGSAAAAGVAPLPQVRVQATSLLLRRGRGWLRSRRHDRSRVVLLSLPPTPRTAKNAPSATVPQRLLRRGCAELRSAFRMGSDQFRQAR